MRDERDKGYFADGALVGKVKQECSSLVDDTTAMVKSEVLFHSATSTDGASRMSSKGSNPVVADPFKIL